MARLKPAVRLTSADARLLAGILESAPFIESLGNPCAEQHFASAVHALHDFCRAGSFAIGSAAPPSADRTRLSKAAAALELSAHHAQALGWATEEQLEELADECEELSAEVAGGEAVAERIRLLVAGAYDAGRKELALRLVDRGFLHWLDESIKAAAECPAQQRPGGPCSYPAESCSLSTFRLEHERPRAFVQPKEEHLSGLVAEMLRALLNEQAL